MTSAGSASSGPSSTPTRPEQLPVQPDRHLVVEGGQQRVGAGEPPLRRSPALHHVVPLQPPRRVRRHPLPTAVRQQGHRGLDDGRACRRLGEHRQPPRPGSRRHQLEVSHGNQLGDGGPVRQLGPTSRPRRRGRGRGRRRRARGPRPARRAPRPRRARWHPSDRPSQGRPDRTASPPPRPRPSGRPAAAARSPAATRRRRRAATAPPARPARRARARRPRPAPAPPLRSAQGPSAS